MLSFLFAADTRTCLTRVRKHGKASWEKSVSLAEAVVDTLLSERSEEYSSVRQRTSLSVGGCSFGLCCLFRSPSCVSFLDLDCCLVLDSNGAVTFLCLSATHISNRKILWVRFYIKQKYISFQASLFLLLLEIIQVFWFYFMQKCRVYFGHVSLIGRWWTLRVLNFTSSCIFAIFRSSLCKLRPPY